MIWLKKIFQKKEPAPVKKKEEMKLKAVEADKEPVTGLKEFSKGTVLGVIEYPHVTEKGSASSGMNKYVFAVSGKANKPEIGRAVESRYGVKVESVHVSNSPGKERVRGKQKGWSPGFKKAIVTLREGQSIEIQ